MEKSSYWAPNFRYATGCRVYGLDGWAHTQALKSGFSFITMPVWWRPPDAQPPNPASQARGIREVQVSPFFQHLGGLERQLPMLKGSYTIWHGIHGISRPAGCKNARNILPARLGHRPKLLPDRFKFLHLTRSSFGIEESCFRLCVRRDFW